MKNCFVAGLVLVLSFLLLSCSGGGGQNPIASDSLISGLPLESSNDGDYRTVYGVFNVEVNPGLQTLTVLPADRISTYNYPLTQLYPNCLSITNYGWTPNFWADIKLSHPQPGSGIDAFDARVIAILPANNGVRFFYPIFNVAGNNAVLLDPDGYTGLHDGIGGPILGNVNPFKSYFKDQPYRVWSSTGVTEETQRWQMNLAGFGGSFRFVLVVDVSMNYPNPPQPIIDNSKEPVAISAFTGDGLTIGGGDAGIEVSVLDWQGLENEPVVSVEIPSFSNSVRNLSFYSLTPQTNHMTYRGVIANNNLAPEGDYNLLVKGFDAQSQKSIYREFTAHVTGMIPDNPIDITPEGLNMHCHEVFIDGNYAYIRDDSNHLTILDISDLSDIEIVKTIGAPDLGELSNIQVFDGKAYGLISSKLFILDIDPPQDAWLIKLVDLTCYESLFVNNGYAYSIDKYNGLCITDVDPPESAYVVTTVPVSTEPIGLSVDGSNLFMACEGSGLEIWDIDPPQDASLINTVDTEVRPRSIDISQGYAYITTGYNTLKVVDIDPALSAKVIKTVDLPESYSSNKIDVTNGFAYILLDSFHMGIFDVSPVENTHFISYMLIDYGSVENSFITNEYIFLAGRDDLGILQIQ